MTEKKRFPLPIPTPSMVWDGNDSVRETKAISPFHFVSVEMTVFCSEGRCKEDCFSSHHFMVWDRNDTGTLAITGSEFLIMIRRKSD